MSLFKSLDPFCDTNPYESLLFKHGKSNIVALYKSHAFRIRKSSKFSEFDHQLIKLIPEFQERLRATFELSDFIDKYILLTFFDTVLLRPYSSSLKSRSLSDFELVTVLKQDKVPLVLITPNYLYHSKFAFEIKPKWPRAFFGKMYDSICSEKDGIPNSFYSEIFSNVLSFVKELLNNRSKYLIIHTKPSIFSDLTVPQISEFIAKLIFDTSIISRLQDAFTLIRFGLINTDFLSHVPGAFNIEESLLLLFANLADVSVMFGADLSGNIARIIDFDVKPRRKLEIYRKRLFD